MLEKLMIRNFRINLLEKDKSPYSSFSKLKYSYEYPIICKIVDNLPNYSLYNDWVYGKVLPHTIGEVGDSNIIVKKSNLESEINWIFISIRKYKDEINKFIEYKKNFEIALLSGSFEIAEELINKIETEICISLWSIENRFLIIEQRKGLKENTNFLNEINTKNKKHFVQSLAHFFSIKAEKELSVNRYQVSFVKFFLPLIEKGYQEDFEYYLFKLDPFLKGSYEHLSMILACENYNSIIDKYLTLLKIFQYSILSVTDTEKNLKEILAQRLFYFDKKIIDPIIDKLSIIINEEYKEYKLTLTDLQCIKALDYYTNGDYKNSEIATKEILITNPLSIEIYSIYVKSLLIQNKEFEGIGKEDSFQYIILSALYDLYKKEKNPVDLGIILRKIAYNLSNINYISYYLIDVVKTEVENNTSFNKLSIINTSFLNPLLGSLYYSSSIYLKHQLEIFPNSNTIKFLAAIEDGSFDSMEKIGVCKTRIAIYKALDYQKRDNFVEAAIIWEDLLNNKDLVNFQRERVLVNLFHCKTELKEYDYCIKLYVDYHFINKFLVLKLNANPVRDQIKKGKYKNIKYSILLPIFFHLTQADDYDIHTSYECFLISSGAEKPSELISNIKGYDKLLLFFLNNICTLEIFKHSPFITSTYDKLNERITICQFLRDIDPDNKKQYVEEENSLSKKLIIQKGLQEIDDSKIYVNQVSIAQNELKDLKSVFNRYMSIMQLSKEKDVAFINIGSERVLNVSFQDQNADNLEFSKDPQYDIFKEIFYDIRDKFLYSKYGLKLYLSARIRHGVLLGEIRPEFELLHLVTEKEKASEVYKINTHWQDYIEPFCNSSVYSKFNTYMSSFSKKIDELINNELLDKYILIKTEKENPEGWLNYEFDEVELQLIYSLIFKYETDYEQFINKIFAELWARTEQNLKVVQENIRNDIKDSFFDAIQSLEISLNSLFIDNLISDLYNNLTDVKVKIENKLNKIAQWFTITDTQISDFEFIKIIEVCSESIHNHYTSKQLDLKQDISCEGLIKGQYYTHFVDLLRIFFQNILDYTTETTVAATIDVLKTVDSIIINVKNELKEDEDIDLLREKINISDDLNRSQLDKQSGLYKALNIVKTNFENENNQLRLDIIDRKFCVSVIVNCENLFV